ncbi:dTMP kinase [Hyalangium rubrum]|uniref:Thymidylate kinase n=1 Tax=Hyalangium rubrum TaxID=3103134 RepID=A0ABU5HAY6_9BACT|nr:dTMP kinase [Hyalangium sp. s54d21]MDY7229285.1 dTMP kinase [Hyalangium sp. s54d21]
MLIVFEGIDGSGKTTLSNRVAQELRHAGLRVRHVREGGLLASPVSEGLRRFTRDPAHLALTPTAELLLYAAREAQLLEEVTRPALAESDVVITDRFFYTAEVLARWGRGMPEHVVRPVLDACARGLTPDRVFLMDVDPALARARRRISKILTPKPGAPSRKGLAGSGLQVRLRSGYRALAAEAPERWTLLENAGVTLETLVRQVVQDILQAREGISPSARTLRAAPSPVRSLEEARGRLLRQLDVWREDEPSLAAYFLSGMEGEDMTERREALAERCPELVAYSLVGFTDEASWHLRRQLADKAPGQVLGSLRDAAADAPESWELRDRLIERVPVQVAESLNGLDSEQAWKMRERIYFSASESVIASLEGLNGTQAWSQRLRWLSDAGGEDALALERVARTGCRSIRGLESERAWTWRERAWAAAPDAVLRSLAGLVSPRAWELREQHVARASRAVLSTLEGLDHPRAWALRESFGAQCEEVLDSIVGMEGAPAWGLRTALADTWPSSTVRSLGPLLQTPRGRALAERLLASHPQDFALLRQATRGAPDTFQRALDATA